MFDAEKWERLIQMEEHGKRRMEILKQAWMEADAEGDYRNRVYYRIEYVNDAVFYDDTMMLYVVFPEYLKLYDEYNATLGNERFTFDVMWDYKWVIGNSNQFYQISVEQMELFCKDFKSRYQLNGYSLSAYYRSRYDFYYNIDKNRASEEFEKFKEEKRGEMSNCLACDRQCMVDYYLRMQEEDEAIRYAQDLFSGVLTCHEIPALTYGSFMLLHMQKQEYEKAEEYCNKLKRCISRLRLFTELIGKILMFYSTTDPSQALDYYKKNYGWYETNKNPYYKFYFAVGASMLWKKLVENKKVIRMKLGRDFPLYEEGSMYHTIALYEHYFNEAKDIAKKFDERNGTEYFMELLECALHGNKIIQWV